MRRHISGRVGRHPLVIRGMVLALAVSALATSGCHTALRRPPAICQCVEDRWGDAVDHVGRTTSISNPRINHKTTVHYRRHRLTQALGQCIATGGPHCYPVRD